MLSSGQKHILVFLVMQWLKYYIKKVWNICLSLLTFLTLGKTLLILPAHIH